MFRPARRKDRAISEEEAKELLRKERRGVLAMYGMEDYPYAVPLNFYYCEETEKIYFHGAPIGHKVEAIKANNHVCFTVYGNEMMNKEEPWAPYMQSTVVFGRCRLLQDPEEALPALRTLARKYYPDDETVEEVMEKHKAGVQVFEITIEHFTGKQIKEK